MDNETLCSVIDKQSRQCIGVDDLVSDERRKAYEYYWGEAKGDLAPSELQGRSSVVSKDLLECVEWAMPALMEIFAASDDIIKFEPDGPEDVQACMDATNYIGYLIHRKPENAFQTLHDAVKSSLICAAGVGKTYVEDGQDDRTERYAGLTEGQLQALRDDAEIEVTEETPSPIVGPEPLFDAVCKRSRTVKVFRNEGMPPEELRVLRGTRSIADVPFIEHRREVTLSYLREQGYDGAKVDELSSDDTRDYDEDNDSRSGDNDEAEPDAPDDSQRKVMLSEAYLKLDMDDSGTTKFWRVVKADNVVFEKEETDDHPFWWFCPLLMPYQVNGMGFYQLVGELQRIRTMLERQVLDNAYLANNPRTEVVPSGILNIDEVISPRIGGMIQVKALGMMREVPTPDILSPGMALLASYDQRRDTRTGVTEMNSAVNGESLSQTNVGSQGVQALMAAGSQRLKLIARVLAETGFRRMYYLMLKNVTQHQDRAQQVRINGRWLQIDPREWRNKYDMTVSVGTGTFGRQEALGNLRALGSMQKELMGLGLVTPQHVYQTGKRIIEQMGYRDADQFIQQPQEGQQPQAQQPDPTALALVEAEKIKAATVMEKAKMDNARALTVEREKIASQERVAMFEARARLDADREERQWQRMQPAPVAPIGAPAV